MDGIVREFCKDTGIDTTLTVSYLFPCRLRVRHCVRVRVSVFVAVSVSVYQHSKANTETAKDKTTHAS